MIMVLLVLLGVHVIMVLLGVHCDHGTVGAVGCTRDDGTVRCTL